MKSTTFFVAGSITFFISIGAFLVIPFALGAKRISAASEGVRPNEDDSLVLADPTLARDLQTPAEDGSDDDTAPYDDDDGVDLTSPYNPSFEVTFADKNPATILEEQKQQSVQIEESIEDVDALHGELEVLLVRVKVNEGIPLTPDEKKLLAVADEADAGAPN